MGALFLRLGPSSRLGLSLPSARPTTREAFHVLASKQACSSLRADADWQTRCRTLVPPVRLPSLPWLPPPLSHAMRGSTCTDVTLSCVWGEILIMMHINYGMQESLAVSCSRYAQYLMVFVDTAQLGEMVEITASRPGDLLLLRQVEQSQSSFWFAFSFSPAVARATTGSRKKHVGYSRVSCPHPSKTSSWYRQHCATHQPAWLSSPKTTGRPRHFRQCFRPKRRG